MNIQVTPHEWLKLPLPTRMKLVEIFNIPQSEGSKVEQLAGTTVMISDGYTVKDLEVITVEKMQQYLDFPSELDDFAKLFDTVVAKIEEGTRPTPLAVEPPDIKAVVLEQWETVLNGMKGQAATHEMTQQLIDTVKRVFDIKTESNVPTRLPAQKGRPKKAK